MLRCQGIIVLLAILLAMPAVCFSLSSPSQIKQEPISFQTQQHTTAVVTSSNDAAATTVTPIIEQQQNQQQQNLSKKQRKKLEQNDPVNKFKWKLMKNLRDVAKDYDMFQDADHIMVCVSGGKDSAALLVLLMELQEKLKPLGINFELTAVHVDQKQPGYDGVPLVDWLNELGVNYQIIEEDTYSIVLDKTSAEKSFCTMCSRLRRGILYSKAIELNCNKIVLGHHADDSLETLILNMLHIGQMKAMPARYTSKRGQLAVMRPLITCMEDDIEEYARLSKFPILSCNLCKNQANLQRPQVKLLLQTLSSFTPDAKKNWLHALGDVKPSHLLDQNLRKAVGMDPITGEEEDDDESEV